MLYDLISADVGPVDVAHAVLHHGVHPHLQRLAWLHEDACSLVFVDGRLLADGDVALSGKRFRQCAR